MKNLLERYPLRQRAILLGLIGLAGQALTRLGVHAGAWIDVANIAVMALVLVGVVSASEPLVTPVADPKATDGTPLIRSDQAAQLVELQQAATPAAAKRSTRRRTEKGHAGLSVLGFVVGGLVFFALTGSLLWALLGGLVIGALAAAVR